MIKMRRESQYSATGIFFHTVAMLIFPAMIYWFFAIFFTFANNSGQLLDAIGAYLMTLTPVIGLLLAARFSYVMRYHREIHNKHDAQFNTLIYTIFCMIGTASVGALLLLIG